MRNQLLAGVSAVGSRFAHLAGLGARKPKAAEEDDKDKKDVTRAEDENDDERAEDENDDKTSAAAEDDDDEEDGGEDDEKKSKKKSKSESDDDRCEDDDEKEKQAVRRGRKMERARWAAVLSSKPAARNVELAVTLLADTSKSAEHIIGRLTASTASTASADRRDRNPKIETADRPAVPIDKKIAASWDQAFQPTLR